MRGIDHVNHSVEGSAVFGPSLSRLVVTAQVVRVEADVADCDFGLMRVQRRVGLREAIALQHVQHRCLACIVQSQEHNIGALLEEAEPLHGPTEEVHNEHFSILLYLSFQLNHLFCMQN